MLCLLVFKTLRFLKIRRGTDFGCSRLLIFGGPLEATFSFLGHCHVSLFRSSGLILGSETCLIFSVSVYGKLFLIFLLSNTIIVVCNALCPIINSMMNRLGFIIFRLFNFKILPTYETLKPLYEF